MWYFPQFSDIFQTSSSSCRMYISCFYFYALGNQHYILKKQYNYPANTIFPFSCIASSLKKEGFSSVHRFAGATLFHFIFCPNSQRAVCVKAVSRRRNKARLCDGFTCSHSSALLLHPRPAAAAETPTSSPSSPLCVTTQMNNPQKAEGCAFHIIFFFQLIKHHVILAPGLDDQMIPQMAARHFFIPCFSIFCRSYGHVFKSADIILHDICFS